MGPRYGGHVNLIPGGIAAGIGVCLVASKNLITINLVAEVVAGRPYLIGKIHLIY
jgi:hypothetical protein